MQRINRTTSQHHQRGVAMLTTTVVVLVAMTVMTAIGARIAVNNQRIAANSAHTDTAFQAADAGIDNALAYLNHNRSYVASSDANGWFHASSSPLWTACDSGFIAPPCGDGSANLYGSDWLAYGPVPNLQAVSADYDTDVYFLSDNINDVPNNDVDLGCLNLSITSVLSPLTVPAFNLVNSTLGAVGLGLPTNLCLPLNFNGANTPPPPSSANPTLRAVSISHNVVDVRGGSAAVQQDLQTASLFVWDPMAALMVAGTANLTGNIKVWGNPRPPSRPPYDWSLLDLNDVAGLNVTALLGSYLGTVAAPLHAATLAPLLNLTVAEVLALDINATFPLSIWSRNNTSLNAGLTSLFNLLNFLGGAKTCFPQFDNVANSTCLVSSYSVDLPLLPALPVKLPDVQDEHNLVSLVTGILDTSSPVDFPTDLFDHIFGVPQAEASLIQQDAVALADCSDLHNKPGGLYWVSGACSITGTVGSVTDPLIVIVDGNLTMAGGSEFWGVMYLNGPSARTVTGSNSGLRPTIHGSLLVGGHLNMNNSMNVVYNRDAIRRAGYRAGRFTRLPGGWTDEVTGP
jgi:Tfp pilus assembly protein PilX